MFLCFFNSSRCKTTKDW